MSLTITIELGDADLQHFIDGMRKAQDEARHLSAQQVTDAAKRLLADSAGCAVPAFIGERLGKLGAMIEMVHDAGWALPDEDKQRVLSALTYFADPKDVIPDTVPVLGFLDDAIMIELCVRELKHELDAYEDFCDFRTSEARRLGVDASDHDVQRADWLEGRRDELQDRMRRRRRDSYSGAGGGWRPTLFKFG
ncbi:YkvA family protein [Tahibacter amnicola]|uniref:YkvA family protein n=1 Tax=Tahibacter amnicola TaxID=2976241 RepID=A0ABY6BEK7_9GAMM|nr:YkvA family protein [Tahibacter amnicola]UXI68468.1 YkvA family protein [Tahibacter amnicola]